jgi:MtaA/CmuA family methyltransferase
MFDAHAKAHAAVTMWRTYSTDAVFYVGDVVVEAEALGVPTEYSDKEMPSAGGAIVTCLEDIERLATPNLLSPSSRTAVNIECVRILAEQFGGRLPILAQVTGPFTTAGALLGYENICRLVVTDPELVERVLERVLPVILEFAAAQCEAGGDVLWVGEPVAALLSPRMFDRFCLPYLKALLGDRDEMSMLHICGDTTAHISRLVATGAQGLSLDTAVDFAAVVSEIPEDIVLIGNIDPVGIMRDGSPDDVLRASNALLEALKDRPNFALSTGCSTPMDTAGENLHALVGAAHEWPMPQVVLS